MNAECGLRNAEEFAQAGNSRDLTDRRSKKGLTLFEILLVLILLVVMASLAKPALESTLASFRLQRGTDQVLADWAKTRSRAIQDGKVYQFRFSKNSSKYRVDSWVADQRTRTSKENQNQTQAPWRLKASIPEAVEFVGGQQAIVGTTGSREVKTLKSKTSAEWSAPILFFPNGTTSEASLLLRNENDRYQRATLRALTGSGRGSKLLTAEEVDQ
ncbi:MAG: hypothetical protein GXP28_00135 [Planctomycetes bacterium]|nr:hypothetical protein [Planctomycetota bacterium]